MQSGNLCACDQRTHSKKSCSPDLKCSEKDDKHLFLGHVDSEMCVYENSIMFTNFNLASSIFGPEFDRKSISSVSIIKKINNSIDIDIVFDLLCENKMDNVIDTINSGACNPTDSILCVKINNANLMKLNLASLIFNTSFLNKNILSVDLFKNYDDSVNFDIAYQQLGPVVQCKPVDSRMCIKNSASNTLRFNLASSVFDNTFDLRPILGTDIIKKRDGSIDVNIIFQTLTTTRQHFPSNPAYGAPINNPLSNPVFNDASYYGTITS